MTFYDEVQEMRARYPEGSRSAVLPALRLAQERHGWLSRQALEETADALQVSHATVERDWAMAKAWLFRRLSGGVAET